MSRRTCVAVDLGAESGRVITGEFDAERLSLDEVHRFSNAPVRQGRHLRWNSHRLIDEITHGLEQVGARRADVTSVAVDAWGVDYGLIDDKGALIEEPYHYRDPRTEGMVERISHVITRERLYELTGVQSLNINTLCQLYSMVCVNDEALKQARHLLMMPDLMNYFLSGEISNELTIATTTQCLDASQRNWALPLLSKLRIPTHLFSQIILPGTKIGPLRPPLKNIPGFAHAQVVAPACHDTASAVAAIPTATEDYAYISSGTWSLMGILSKTPIMNQRALELGFTNEGGVDGQVRVLRNITGLWLVQQCRKVWAERGHDLDYESITKSAESSAATDHAFDPDDPILQNPIDMPAAIMRLCSEVDSPLSGEIGAIARAIFQSLACKYCQTLDQLQELLGRRPSTIHIVGGGSKNAFLRQLTADACGVRVLAGPAETTALGNILAQAIASGQCSSWTEARETVRRCSAVIEYLPRFDSRWDGMRDKFRIL